MGRPPPRVVQWVVKFFAKDGRLKITGLFQANKGPTMVNGKLDWSRSWVQGDEALRIKLGARNIRRRCKR